MTRTDRKEVSRQVPEIEPPVAFGLALSTTIREAVIPVYGIKETQSRESGLLDDFVYQVDNVAEELISRSFASAWEQGQMYGYVTEDQGLVLPPGGEAEYIFLIDPVDGSRMAQTGTEMSCITMVMAKGIESTFSDIEFGITHTIKEDTVYFAKKNAGVYQMGNGLVQEVKRPLGVTHLDRSVSLVYQPYGVSLEYQGRVLDPLLKDIGFASTYPCDSYFALSLVRGQNEIHLNLIHALLEHNPEASYGHAKALYPMDVAAGWLMIKELGGVITDAYGNPLDYRQLWQFELDGKWSPHNQISWVASLNENLHREVLGKINEGLRRL